MPNVMSKIIILRSVLGPVDEVAVPPAAGFFLSGVLDQVQSLVLESDLSQLDGKDVPFPTDFQELLFALFHLGGALDEQLLHFSHLAV
jgi:hypothetical protein